MPKTNYHTSPREQRGAVSRRLSLLAKMIDATASAAGLDSAGFENWEMLTLAEMFQELSRDLDAAENEEIEAEDAEILRARAAAAGGVQ